MTVQCRKGKDDRPDECCGECAVDSAQARTLVDDMARELADVLDDLAELLFENEQRKAPRRVAAYREQIDRVKGLLSRYEAGER